MLTGRYLPSREVLGEMRDFFQRNGFAGTVTIDNALQIFDLKRLGVACQRDLRKTLQTRKLSLPPPHLNLI